MVHAKGAGAMRTAGNYGRAKNYGPNSFDGPTQTGQPPWSPIEVHGLAQGSTAPSRPEDDDFTQAGLLYRLMSEAEKQRLVGRIAASLSLVSRGDIIERSIGYFRKADRDYGETLAKAVSERRAKS